ncbi:MAG: hypothetical protein R3C16_11425 [Hyphomonadaceae bacterium]
MPRRQQATRLREVTDAPPPQGEAKVIDAKFSVVGPKPRGWLARLWMGLVALGVAALIGFLIPPLWIILREIFAQF